MDSPRVVVPIVHDMRALISVLRTHPKGLLSTLSPPSNQNLSEQVESIEKHTTAGRSATIEEMKGKVLTCLDDIPLDQIHQWA